MITKIKKSQINGRIYDVCSLDDYLRYRESYLQGYVAVQMDGYVLPVVPSLDCTAGVSIPNVTPGSKPLAVYCKQPDQSDPHYNDYKESNIIDYSDVNTMAEFVKKQNVVRSLEKDVLTNPDNIFVPKIEQSDSPAMKAIKQAVIDKHIDIDKYEPRFGSNFNNDKRLFNKENISLPMCVRVCNALDIKATLTLENASDDVPNPMKEPITVELTGYSDKV